MHRNANRHKAAEAFVNGQTSPRDRGSVFTDGRAIYSYGTHFVMAYRDDEGNVLVNTDRYSVTTSRHQSALRGVLATNGYEPTGYVVNGFEVWR